MPSLSFHRNFSRIATLVAVVAVTAGFAGIAFSQANNGGGAAPVILSPVGCANPGDLVNYNNSDVNLFTHFQATCDSHAEELGFTEGILQPSIGVRCHEPGQQYWVCSGVGGCSDLNCSTH